MLQSLSSNIAWRRNNLQSKGLWGAFTLLRDVSVMNGFADWSIGPLHTSLLTSHDMKPALALFGAFHERSPSVQRFEKGQTYVLLRNAKIDHKGSWNKSSSGSFRSSFEDVESVGETASTASTSSGGSKPTRRESNEPRAFLICLLRSSVGVIVEPLLLAR